MTGQAGVKPSGGVCAGVLGGCALLLFAGALVATSQMPGLDYEATSGLRGRRLQTAPVSIINAPASGVPAVVPAAVPAPTDTVATPSGGVVVMVTPAPAAAVEVTSVQTTVSAAAIVGALAISVVDASKFTIGQWVMVGSGLAVAENRHIKAVDTTLNTLTFARGLINDHAVNEAVVLQPESLHQQSLHQSSSGPSASLASSDSSSGSFARSSDSLLSFESGSSEGQFLKAMTWTEGGSALGGWFLNIALALCYACVYKSKVVEPMGVMPHQALQHEMHNDFRYGLCDCWKDINMCCMTMCCPFVRMAHTNEVADVCGFWESLFCLACSSLCICGPLCMQVYFRIHIKDHMGIQDHCFNDFCTAFFCLPCVTGQQALAVDEVMGWKFKCPCNIEHVSASGGYGQAGNWS